MRLIAGQARNTKHISIAETMAHNRHILTDDLIMYRKDVNLSKLGTYLNGVRLQHKCLVFSVVGNHRG